MDFSSKVSILGDFWLNYRQAIVGNTAWEEFFQYNDVALPLSYMHSQGLATIVEDSEGPSFIEDTWIMLCEYIDVDPDDDYVDLDDMFIKSPNQTDAVAL